MNTVTKIAAAAVLWIGCVATAAAGIEVNIDRSSQKMYVAVDGVTKYVWRVSTGKRGYDTPQGDFRPFRLEQEHFSTEWNNAPMPHSIFFTNQGHAIHGTNKTRQLGRTASHGCVRLAPREAAKLFELVSRAGLGNTTISITDTVSPAVIAGDIVDTRSVY
jgi:lipoprotein-anchoring transpeptidase ErfK/SrfK